MTVSLLSDWNLISGLDQTIDISAIEDIEEIKDMKETFYFFDKDGNGLIPEAKVGTVMRVLGFNLRDAEIQNLILHFKWK